MSEVDDKLAIHELLASYANSFDRKAWDELGACLSDTLHTDYSQLRKTPAETISRERFVELRRDALDRLDTHHLLSNVQVRLNGRRGEATASMAIFRKNAQGERFDTHCLYLFGVRKHGPSWLIHSIVQKVLWNEGSDSVHSGVPRDGDCRT
ncbi:nuclear transport factor 2 family protein [Acidihalobacter prosperus]